MFRSFANYTDITPIVEAKSETSLLPPQRFIAKEEPKTSPDNPAYTDRWFLLKRKRLFDAQVEKAMAEIDHHFLGYSTQIEMIQAGEDYYVASREIARFKTWAECRNNVKLLDDGTLVLCNGDKNKVIKGLGTICTYADFFKGSDPHSGNFGIQENETNCVVVLIDRESSLSFNLDNEEDFNDNNFEGEFDSKLIPAEYRETAQFKEEKQAILEKIAKDDFGYVEKVLNQYVTSNQLEDSKKLMEKMLLNANDEDKEQYQMALEQIKSKDSKTYSLENIIKELRVQRQILRKELGISQQPAKAAFFKAVDTIEINKNGIVSEKPRCHYPDMSF